MKRRVLAMLLALILGLSLLPAASAAYDEKGNYAYVRLKYAGRDGATYYFTYRWNDSEFCSLDMGPAMNYKAFTMMTDAEKRQVSDVFSWSKEKRTATFGETGGTAVWRYRHEATGWGPAARKYLQRVEKCYTDPVLLRRYSDTASDVAGKSWFEKTMAEEFTPGEDLTGLYGYDYVTVNVLFMKEYIRRAQTSMKTGHEYYSRLTHYEKLAVEAATKGISKELIKIITDHLLVPAFVPEAKYASELASAAWDFGETLWGIYMDASKCQENLEKKLYGDSLDPGQVIAEANTMSEMMIFGCNNCYTNAKADWARAQQLAEQIRKEIAEYNAERDAARARIAAAREKAKQENIVPTHAQEVEVEQVVENVPDPTVCPGEYDYTKWPNEAAWEQAVHAWIDHYYSSALALQPTRDALLAQWAQLKTEWDTWMTTWEDNLEEVYGETPPTMNSAFVQDDWSYLMSSNLGGDYFSPAEMARVELAGNYGLKYIDEVLAFVKKRGAALDALHAQEADTCADLLRRYQDLELASQAYSAGVEEKLRGMETGCLQRDIITMEYVKEKRKAVWQAVGVDNGWGMPVTYLRDTLHGDYSYQDNTLLWGYTNELNIKLEPALGHLGHKSYYVGNGPEYVSALGDQLVEAETLVPLLEEYRARAESTLASKRAIHKQYLDQLRDNVGKYHTARDNYELARKAFVDAAVADHKLLAALPDYVKDQAVLGENDPYATHPFRYIQCEDARANNPALYDLLHNTQNRPMLVGQIKQTLQSLWKRHCDYANKMENAYQAMEADANAALTAYQFFRKHIDDDTGHNLRKDYFITLASPILEDDYLAGGWGGYIPKASYVKDTMFGYTRAEEVDLIALELLDRDFSGGGRVQSEVEECKHLLKINTVKILREAAFNAPYGAYSQTLESIFNRYNNAVQTVFNDSWAGLKGSANGRGDTDFVEAWYALKQRADSFYTAGKADYVGVTGIAKGDAPASLLDTAPVYDLTLAENASARLTAVITPKDATEKTVVWESSSTDIATVDETGRVTALSPGVVTITAHPLDSDAVPIDENGQVMAVSKSSSSFGSPVETDSSHFSGYTYVISDTSGFIAPTPATLEYAVLVTPRSRAPVELADETGALLDAIPPGPFRVTLFAGLDDDTAEQTVLTGVYLAAYDDGGQMIALRTAAAAVDTDSTTLRAEFDLDNTAGTITRLKGFILDALGHLTPLRGALALPTEQ